MGYIQYVLYIQYLIINKMKEEHYKYLALVSLVLLCLTLFQLTTLCCLGACICFCCLFINSAVQRHLDCGLLPLLPNSLRTMLQQTSPLQLLQQIISWKGMTIFRTFLTTLFRSLFQGKKTHVHRPKHVSPELRSDFQLKPILHVLPRGVRQALVGRVDLTTHHTHQWVSKDVEMDSTEGSRRMQKFPRRNSTPLLRVKYLEPTESEESEGREVVVKHEKSIQEITTDMLDMVKGVWMLLKMPAQLRKINLMKLTKYSIVFWILVILQMKANPKAKEAILKALMVAAGAVTVIGAISTTSMLAYTYLQSSRHHLPKQQEIQG